MFYQRIIVKFINLGVNFFLCFVIHLNDLSKFYKGKKQVNGVI